MKSSTIFDHPRIEILHSAHIDKGKEQMPTIPAAQAKIGRFIFRTLGYILPKYMARQAYKIFSTPRWRAQHRQPDDLIRLAKVTDFPFDGHTVKLYEWGENTRHTEGFGFHPFDTSEMGDDKSLKHTEAGQIVLLAHGWESRGTALRMYVPDLVASGFRVVAFDALAHGDSDGKQNNLQTNARTIAAIHKHYGGFYAAIGHSFGCASIVTALQFVDNAIAIERLVFLAVPHRTRRIMEGFFKFIAAPMPLQTAFYQYIETIYERSIDLSDVALAYPSVKVGKLLLAHDRFDNIASIDAAVRIVERWENAHLLVTEGYGHFRISKNPDVIRRVITFITNLNNLDA